MFYTTTTTTTTTTIRTAYDTIYTMHDTTNSFPNDARTPCNQAHGTHVSGSVVGSSYNSANENSDYGGILPEAKIGFQLVVTFMHIIIYDIRIYYI